MNRSADFQIGVNRADLEVGAPELSVQGVNARPSVRENLTPPLSPPDGSGEGESLAVSMQFEPHQLSLAHERIPQQNGSLSSSNNVASEFTKAVPLMMGETLPASRSSQRNFPVNVLPMMLS